MFVFLGLISGRARVCSLRSFRTQHAGIYRGILTASRHAKACRPCPPPASLAALASGGLPRTKVEAQTERCSRKPLICLVGMSGLALFRPPASGSLFVLPSPFDRGRSQLESEWRQQL